MKAARILKNKTRNLGLLSRPAIQDKAIRRFRGESCSSTSAVLPWPLQPIVNVEEQETAVLAGVTIEERTRSAEKMLEKKRNFYLCMFLMLTS